MNNPTMNDILRQASIERQKATAMLAREMTQNEPVKEVEFESKYKLIQGVRKVSKAVGSTLGAKGRLVIFTEDGRTQATKDGATVVENIKLQDVIENYGRNLLAEATRLTARTAGDGTSTTALLTQFILDKLELSRADRNFYEVQKGMLKAVKDVTKLVKEYSQEISLDLIYKIAYTSSNNNKDIAEAITNIYINLKRSEWDINIIFNKSDLLNDEISVEKGYEISHKTSSITTRTIKDNVLIVLLDYKATSLGAPLAETVIRSLDNKQPVLFICRDFTEEFTQDLKNQSKLYNVSLYAVKLDLYGNDATNQMRDLEHATNAVILDEPLNERVDANDILGKVKTVIFSLDRTNILFEEEVPEYIESLEESKKDVSDFDKISINRRLQKLRSVTANYYVGGTTPQEMEERYYRIEDAILAVNTAIRYGVIVGGGVTYLKIYDKLIENNKEVESDFQLGYNTVLESLLYPFLKLCTNSYIDYTSHLKIHDEIKSKNFDCIYNFATEAYEIGKDISIYDTAKTGQVALEAAVSVASTILLTSAIIL